MRSEKDEVKALLQKRVKLLEGKLEEHKAGMKAVLAAVKQAAPDLDLAELLKTKAPGIDAASVL